MAQEDRQRRSAAITAATAAATTAAISAAATTAATAAAKSGCDFQTRAVPVHPGGCVAARSQGPTRAVQTHVVNFKSFLIYLGFLI